MSCENHGSLGAALGQNFPEISPVLRVKPGAGLIQEYDFWVSDEGDSDTQPPPHSSAQLSRLPGLELLQPDLPERHLQLLLFLLLRDSLQAGVEQEVFLDGQVWPEEVELRADTDIHVNFFDLVPDRVPADPGFSGGWRNHARQDRDQSRFPGSVRPEQPEDLALLYLDRESLQSNVLGSPGVAVIFFPQIFADQRILLQLLQAYLPDFFDLQAHITILKVSEVRLLRGGAGLRRVVGGELDNSQVFLKLLKVGRLVVLLLQLLLDVVLHVYQEEERVLLGSPLLRENFEKVDSQEEEEYAPVVQILHAVENLLRDAVPVIEAVRVAARDTQEVHEPRKPCRCVHSHDHWELVRYLK